MRKITLKYSGVCNKCGKSLDTGNAMYEKMTGIFCVGCEPTETEDIRHYRTIKAEKKAKKRLEWAGLADKRGDAYYNQSTEMASRIPMGQPIMIGHHSERRDRRYRKKIWDKMGKSVEYSNLAKHHRDKAENILNVRVKGDAERQREEIRNEMDKRVKKGSRVYDFAFGEGEVVGIYKKSYRIKFDTGSTFSRDKSYVKLATL